jgi:hypothetical protein
MDRTRLRQEVDALAQKYHVAPNNDLQGYELRDFNYPGGWVLNNRRYWRQRDGVPRGPAHVAPLLIRIPDSYPYSQPYAYVPRSLVYTDGPVNHLINSPYQDWAQWCVRDLDWDPTEHSIPWLLGFIQLSFSNPDVNDPLSLLDTVSARR